MLAMILIVAIVWGVYGLVAGFFMGSDSFLKYLGYVMTLIYVVTCIKALFDLDWSLVIGIPCFAAGVGTGINVTARANTNSP